MKSLIPAFLLVWSHGQAFAASADPRVVKIASHACADRPALPIAYGSGFWLKTPDGRHYIVTASHVLYHGGRQDGVCQSVLSADGAVIPDSCVDFQAADALKDLALLRVDGSCLPQGAPAAVGLDELADASEGERLLSSGFPAASGRAVGYQAYALTTGSPRHLIPGVDEVTEIAPTTDQTITSEFGMSGGLVRAADGRPVGLLSQQYLEISEGAPTVIADHAADEPRHGAFLVSLVLSGKNIKSWLAAVLGPDAAGMPQVLADQKAGVASIDLEGLRFTEQNCFHRQTWIGGHGVSIGGPAPTPTGTPSADCKILMSLLPESAPSPAWPFAATDFFASTRALLHDGISAASVATVSLDANRVGISSVLTLFKALREGDTADTVKYWHVKQALRSALAAEARQRSVARRSLAAWLGDPAVQSRIREATTNHRLTDVRTFFWDPPELERQTWAAAETDQVQRYATIAHFCAPQVVTELFPIPGQCLFDRSANFKKAANVILPYLLDLALRHGAVDAGSVGDDDLFWTKSQLAWFDHVVAQYWRNLSAAERLTLHAEAGVNEWAALGDAVYASDDMDDDSLSDFYAIDRGYAR